MPNRKHITDDIVELNGLVNITSQFEMSATSLLEGLKMIEHRLVGILPDPFHYECSVICYRSNILTSDAKEYGPGLVIHTTATHPWGNPLPPEYARIGGHIHFGKKRRVLNYCTLDQLLLMAQTLPKLLNELAAYLGKSGQQFAETVSLLDAMYAASRPPIQRNACAVCGHPFYGDSPLLDHCGICGTPKNVDLSCLVMCPSCDRANNPIFPTCYHCGAPIHRQDESGETCECTTLEILQRIGIGRFTGGAKYGFCPLCGKRTGQRSVGRQITIT